MRTIMQEMWVVTCTKKVDTTSFTQVFGPYRDMNVAEDDAAAWHERNGWSCCVRPVYPRESKLSLLQPSKIGAC